MRYRIIYFFIAALHLMEVYLILSKLNNKIDMPIY